jgi:hypothetical protein
MTTRRDLRTELMKLALTYGAVSLALAAISYRAQYSMITVALAYAALLGLFAVSAGIVIRRGSRPQIGNRRYRLAMIGMWVCLAVWFAVKLLAPR